MFQTGLCYNGLFEIAFAHFAFMYFLPYDQYDGHKSDHLFNSTSTNLKECCPLNVGEFTSSRFAAGQFFCGSGIAAFHGKYDAYGNQ